MKHWFHPIGFLLLSAVLAQSCVSHSQLQSFRSLSFDNMTTELEESALSTVGLPSCTGVLIGSDLVLTRQTCLAATQERGYVVLGQAREHPVRKLLPVLETQALGEGLGLIRLSESAPQPYRALSLNTEDIPVLVGQTLWSYSYAPEGDLQSFGQLSQHRAQLLEQSPTQLQVEGRCVSPGSPLVLRYKGRGILLGLAPDTPDECQAGQESTRFDRPQLTAQVLEQVLKALKNTTELPRMRSPLATVEDFRLLSEIKLDQAPFTAAISLGAQAKQATCEYSLRVVRHNSFFETRYNLRSQPVHAGKLGRAQLIFEDIYANLSPLIGRVKHVELSSTSCQSA